MPVIIPENLPAVEILQLENIFVIDNKRAISQDIRPLKIIILNLMPLKIETETQLLRLLTNSPLQIEVEFIHPKAHFSKNTSVDHLEYFYQTFENIKNNKYDGLIITGAPVELLDFERVDYWNEFVEVLEWSKANVTSVLLICWAAQAGLKHLYGIDKIILNEKVFGNFKHSINNIKSPIIRGFDEIFYAPHSRYTGINELQLKSNKNLEIISHSEEAGIYIILSRDNKYVFVTGHSEYNKETIKNEYERDLKKGLNTPLPKNYFIDNNPNLNINYNWRSHAYLLFQNWLNYYVYQITPYKLN